MTGKLVVGVAAIAAFVGYCFSRAQGAQAAKREGKEDLGRWEGEGGNVPAVATPSPAPFPATSIPESAPGLRH